jgi:dihydrofolate reductase
MSRLRVHSFAISLDGYGAGPDQNLDNPLGRGGLMLHEWRSRTRTFQELFGSGGGETGVDNDFEARGLENVGAWILGRNMFAPIRGDWPDDRWRGWWGNNPPYHTDVFILTHHARAPIDMEGGTTFHFVTEGVPVALEKAKSAAQGKDVRLGGGVNTIRQYLQAGSLTKSMSRSARSCLARESICLVGSTPWPWDMFARSTSQVPTLLTSCWPGSHEVDSRRSRSHPTPSAPSRMPTQHVPPCCQSAIEAGVGPDGGRASPLAFMLHTVLYGNWAADGLTPDLLNAWRFDGGEHEPVT